MSRRFAHDPPPARSLLLAGAGPDMAVGGGAAAVTIYLGLNAGGYFPDSTAAATIGLAVALILRVALAENPFEGLRWRAVIPAAGLVLFAIWVLSSSAWSHSPSRALLEFNRVLLYLLALVLFASLGHRPGRLTALACGLALGSVVVCTAGLASRTLPAVFPVAAAVRGDRLSYPLTYANALGLLAVLGIIICLGLSAAGQMPRAARAVSAAAIPPLTATLLLTFSRGAIAAGILALAILCLLSPTRALLLTLLASAPAAGVALAAAYSATAIVAKTPMGPRAVSQGHRVAITVGLASLGALGLRAVLSRWDRGPVRRPALRGRARRVVAVLGAMAAVGGAVGAAATFDLPGQLSRQYHSFVTGTVISAAQDRQRLLNAGNGGRLPIWSVAVRAWRADALRGAGAGTFQTLWYRGRRPSENIGDIVNSHSLYLGTLAELGVVGLVLLAVCLGGLLTGCALRVRPPPRALAGALFAAAVCWAVHTAIDWDWEMPVTTWWVFALGGLALARGPRDAPALARPGRLGRLLAMVAVAVVALTPAQVALSQAGLTNAVAAFKRNDCRAAVGFALDSLSHVGARAEPYEVIGYCDARDGHGGLAIAAVQNAINRDPENWEFRYDMAVVRAGAGRDPRAAVAQARQLNPLNPVVVRLAAALRPSNPRVWRAQAARAPVLIP